MACSTKLIGSTDFSSHMRSYPSLDILLGFDSQCEGLQLMLKCCWSKKCKERYLTKLPWWSETNQHHLAVYLNNNRRIVVAPDRFSWFWGCFCSPIAAIERDVWSTIIDGGVTSSCRRTIVKDMLIVAKNQVQNFFFMRVWRLKQIPSAESFH